MSVTETDQDPATVGRWTVADARFDALPVHTAVLHTGNVLALGGSGNDETHLRNPHPAELYDPASGTTETVGGELAGDVFCAGHAFLPDGRLLVAGGTRSYDGEVEIPIVGLRFPPFEGLDHAYLFDPEQTRWERVDDMRHGRWYPTCVTLGDGRVLTAAGLTGGFPWVALREIEVYDPDAGWSPLRGAGRWLPLYPRLHLLPNGDVFYAGSYNTHYTFPFTLRGFPTAILDMEHRRWIDLGLPNQSQREEGASVLLPLRPEEDYRARILLAGGGTPGGTTAVADAEVMDLGDVTPRWRAVESLEHARYYAYPVLLPDGTVLVVGGRRGKGHGHHHPGYDPETGEVLPDPRAVYEPELFELTGTDPVRGTWTPLAPMSIDRLYHSHALLLPDGRVLTAGSNPRRRVDERRIELFEPPYLFRGERPTIEDAPDAVAYGESFEIGTPDAATGDEVVLLRQSSSTHCTNTDQRYVGLTIDGRGGDVLTTHVPDNPNLLPPGYYMLFVLRDGVPSEAPFVRVG